MKAAPDLLAPLPEMAALRRRLGGRRGPVAAGGLWGASLALVAAALAAERPLLLLVPDEGAGEELAEDLVLFGLDPGEAAQVPTLPDGEDAAADPAACRRLLVALAEIRRGVRVALLPLPALARPLPAPDKITANRVLVRRGAPLDPAGLAARAVQAGFRRVPLVAAPGEVSLRGDLLDLFPLSARDPFRVETLDGEVESLRRFDPESQRSLSELAEAELLLLPAGGDAGPEGGPEELGEWVGAAGEGRLLVRVEPGLLEERGRTLAAGGERAAACLEAVERALSARPALSLQGLPRGEGLDFTVHPVPPPAAGEDALERIEKLALAHSLLVCGGEPERRRLLARLEGRLPAGVEVATGRLSRGFRLPAAGLSVFSHDELEGLRPLPRPRRAAEVPARALRGFYELRRGDLVVHAVHGIARFVGIRTLEKGGSPEDHLELEFAGEVTLYVPVSRIELVQKYIGSGQASPALDRLGGRAFAGRKEAVRRAVADMAADLIRIQALRRSREGYAFPADDELQRGFEAEFPFTETPDQAKVMEEIRQDMLSPRPMDRLICGDVGFGKTELALRAAFKAVLAGRQVAVLVPTTILAEQHLETFRARMADWPVRVEALSRLRSGGAADRILAAAARGEVDVLIGTHRLLSKDVTLPNLGLVVIDEEQRFGVSHKESFKRMRALVDVLTLTATPIPRTLHMSLLGLRDISALTTPPAGRQEIATLVRPRDPELIRQGIRRELHRGGQVFFLHNRVQSIDEVARELRSLVPEARLVVGHGQMPERQLERAMMVFVSGGADLLLSTSIIESGLDIPRANTIFIDRADRFGLADLHQLRGRVGRYRHKAYAYLLYEPLDPPRGDAALRLKALEELTRLGAGFAIAMRDLEIRGSGNILGAEQSGHIAAVGYDMYCRLLRAAAAAMKGEEVPDLEEEDVEIDLGVEAWLPPDYIPDEELRLEALRVMERAAQGAGAEEALAELRDRYGPPPPPVRHLARLFAVRRRLLRAGVREIRYDRRDRLVVRHPPGRPPRGAWADRFAAVRLVQGVETHLVLPAERHGPLAALAFLEEVLPRLQP